MLLLLAYILRLLLIVLLIIIKSKFILPGASPLGLVLIQLSSLRPRISKFLAVQTPRVETYTAT